MQLAFEAGAVFTPGAPINERELFAGRMSQIGQIINAISQRGYHAVLYGERGVGKTSLSNVLHDFLRDSVSQGRLIVSRVNCDATDSYTSLWHKALKDLTFSVNKPTAGFNSDPQSEQRSLLDTLPAKMAPDDVRRLLSGKLFQGMIVTLIFDEFDRLQDKTVCSLMADTIKSLSDYSVDATILLIGVAESVDKLIHEHQSIERALVQVPMPRMSNEEIEQIITNGLTRLTMTAEEPALEEIAALAQGLPYIAHLLGLHSAKVALLEGKQTLTLGHLQKAIQMALDQWQQSIKSSYYEAVSSNQPDTIYRHVLLGCALAETDEMGFFTPAAVRSPLSIVTEKKYDIPGYSRHLKDFTEEDRAQVLERYGESGRRFRFSSPLMRPYVIMRGFADGLLNKDKMDAVEAAQKSAT